LFKRKGLPREKPIKGRLTQIESFACLTVLFERMMDKGEINLYINARRNTSVWEVFVI